MLETRSSCQDLSFLSSDFHSNQKPILPSIYSLLDNMSSQPKSEEEHSFPWSNAGGHIAHCINTIHSDYFYLPFSNESVKKWNATPDGPPIPSSSKIARADHKWAAAIDREYYALLCRHLGTREASSPYESSFFKWVFCSKSIDYERWQIRCRARCVLLRRASDNHHRLWHGSSL